jgi:hypothetical protein
LRYTCDALFAGLFAICRQQLCNLRIGKRAAIAAAKIN